MNSPHDKLRLNGAQALSTNELIEIVCSCSSHVADLILQDRDLRDVLRLPLGSLSALKTAEGGMMGESRAARLQAALELGIRLDNCHSPLVFRGPVDMWSHFKRLRYEPVEHLLVAGIASSREVVVEAQIVKGCENVVSVCTLDIIRPVLRAEGAYYLVMVHNHPSGMPEPSSDDNKTTMAVGRACKACSLSFLDHIIIGLKGYYAYSEHSPKLLTGGPQT